MSETDVVRVLVRRMISAGERMPACLRGDIVALGPAALPALIAILADDDLALSKSPGQGWAPVHAARLLGELRSAEAIEPMLRVLAETDPLDLLHDQVIQSLSEIGEALVEPALRAYRQSDDPDVRISIASVLARAGVRDDRILSVLLEVLAAEPSHGAGDLAHYGDERALPGLFRAFDDYQAAPDDHPLANQTLVELHAAIEDLGGKLTPAHEEKLRRIMEPAERWRQRLNAALEHRAPTQPPPRPGRNEPCWCGSSKKYKKCHLAADELPAAENSQGVPPG